MNPDIHTAIPADVYHAWDLVSASRLRDFARSPAYCRYRMKQPREQTDAMRIGTLVHMAVLEPVRFQALPIAPEVNKRTKLGKEEWAHYLLTTDTPMSKEEHHRCLSIGHSVRAHPVAGELLKRSTHIEASLVWTDPATGLGCKARPDVLLDGICADLKVTRGAHPDRFPREVNTYGMHRQAAHYLSGLKVLGHGAEVFVVIAVENTEPYECVVYEMHPDTIEAGRLEVVRLTADYLACTISKLWPGYSDETQQLNLPEWRLRELLPEQAITMGGKEVF